MNLVQLMIQYETKSSVKGLQEPQYYGALKKNMDRNDYLINLGKLFLRIKEFSSS